MSQAARSPPDTAPETPAFNSSQGAFLHNYSAVCSDSRLRLLLSETGNTCSLQTLEKVNGRAWNSAHRASKRNSPGPGSGSGLERRPHSPRSRVRSPHRHTQEATNESTSKWNKWIRLSVSLSPSLPLPKVNKIKETETRPSSLPLPARHRPVPALAPDTPSQRVAAGREVRRAAGRGPGRDSPELAEAASAPA